MYCRAKIQLHWNSRHLAQRLPESNFYFNTNEETNELIAFQSKLKSIDSGNFDADEQMNKRGRNIESACTLMQQ